MLAFLLASSSISTPAAVPASLRAVCQELQLIVHEGGSAAVNFEHTAVDGHTVLRFVSDIFADTVLRFVQQITATTHGRKYLPALLDPKHAQPEDAEERDESESHHSSHRVVFGVGRGFRSGARAGPVAKKPAGAFTFSDAAVRVGNGKGKHRIRRGGTF